MRCKACNTLLTDKEAAKKDPYSGEYTDMCSGCWSEAYDALLVATETFEKELDKVSESE